MILYSSATSPRLDYVVHFLSRYYGTSVQITTDLEVFSSTQDVRLNYTSQAIEGTVWIKPYGLLSEKGIREIDADCYEHDSGYTAFFKTDGILQFDILSAIFYLITRYEEYNSKEKDAYGRYAHQASVAFRKGFLHLPLSDIWLEDFRKLLNEQTNCSLPARQFSFLPTYDIDMAWSYRNKGVLRNTGGLIKSLLKGDTSSIRERLSVLTGTTPDPYDAFEWMDKMHEVNNLKPVYFFHVGQRRNKYDKNISTENEPFQQLIERTAAQYKVGLHPSWHSGDEEAYLGIEKKVLQDISGTFITASRQHYIRLTIPYTYRRLIEAGIAEDYSMGYATVNGFRASIANSFYWYDLELENETPLLIHPFCFMDANAYFEQRQLAEESYEELMQYYQVVKKLGGTLCTLWHNTFLGTDPLFKGWKEVYEKAVAQIASNES